MRPLRALFPACGWLMLCVASSRADTNLPAFGFKDYLIAPLRVHLLAATNGPAIQTTLAEADISRILKKINAIWGQAGIGFQMESLVREQAAHQELDSLLDTPRDLSLMTYLRPEASKATNLFHLYYLKRFSANGVYVGEAMFIKDTAFLRAVPGGIDEPLPRVSAHELGHALGLMHHTNVLHLLASRTTGTNLDAAEVRQARAAAARIPWIEKAPALLRRVDELREGGRRGEARRLYEMLEGLPLDDLPPRPARAKDG